MSQPSLDTSFFGMLPQVEGLPFLSQSRIVVESKLFEREIGGAFLGKHTGLDIPVVIRVMHTDVRNSFSDFGRFLLAMRQLARVRHPNSASIFDLGEFNGHPYLVLEYVCGIPLIERIKNRPLKPSHALQMLTPIASALCEFWSHDIVHRTVSPDFIYLQCEGPAKLDITALCCSQCHGLVKESLSQKLLPYWSPEEIRGDEVRPASDMWSFGATLYQAITGHTPFGGQSQKELQAAILLEEPADPRKYAPDTPQPLCDLLMKLLSRDPMNRFVSGEAFMTALRSVDEHCSRPTLPPLETELLPPPLSPGMPQASPIKDSPSNGVTRPVREPRIGDVIGQCRLIRRAGSGAFGVVYQGRHTVLDIDVAVKVLPPDTASREPGFIEMFLREARTAARIRHPNVIGIYAAGEQEGQYYLTMEYAPGGTVWDRMHLFGGTLPANEVIQIMRDTAQGLSAAQKAGVVHRDIKPDNLMYGTDNQIKIADLGLAKRRMPVGDPEKVRASIVAEQITMRNDPHMMAGTPVYMAPEMAVSPQTADTRADLYSLGITAYQMLTGVLPFEGQNALETIMKHVTEKPRPPKELVPEIPEFLNTVIMKLIEKQPTDRFQSPEELIQALAEVEAMS